MPKTTAESRSSSKSTTCTEMQETQRQDAARRTLLKNRSPDNQEPCRGEGSGDSAVRKDPLDFCSNQHTCRPQRSMRTSRSREQDMLISTYRKHRISTWDKWQDTSRPLTERRRQLTPEMKSWDWKRSTLKPRGRRQRSWTRPRRCY